MPKPHHTTAPTRVRDRIDLFARSPHILGESGQHVTASAAYAQLQAQECAYRSGYDWPPEDVKTPATDRLKELEAAGDRNALAAFRRDRGIDLKYEAQSITRARAMRAWAVLPTEAELAAERVGAALAAEHEEAIEKAAQQIVADAEREASEKRLMAARKKAAEKMQKGIQQ